MWLFSQTGFVSAVMNSDEQVVVRARDKKSLISLATEVGGTIQRTPLADYPYRAVVSKFEFTTWLLKSVFEIDYSNFKNKVVETRGADYSSVLSRVWSEMHDVEDSEARARIIL
jgi:hypothetical protein